MSTEMQPKVIPPKEADCYYSILGQSYDTPVKGITIHRDKRGTVKKIRMR